MLRIRPNKDSQSTAFLICYRVKADIPEFLMIRHADNQQNYSRSGLWDLPGGAREYTDNENPNAAFREFTEETKIKLPSNIMVEDVMHGVIGTKEILHYYLVDLTNAEVSLKKIVKFHKENLIQDPRLNEEHEVAEIGWMSADESISRLLEGDIKCPKHVEALVCSLERISEKRRSREPHAETAHRFYPTGPLTYGYVDIWKSNKTFEERLKELGNKIHSQHCIPQDNNNEDTEVKNIKL